MSKKASKRQKRVDKLLDFLRTYGAFVQNYGGCVKSVDLLCKCNRTFAVAGPILMQDIIREYNLYGGGLLDNVYRNMCRNHTKRRVYQETLLTDWNRAVNIYYSCGLSIPGLTREEVIDALKSTYKLVK